MAGKYPDILDKFLSGFFWVLCIGTKSRRNVGTIVGIRDRLGGFVIALAEPRLPLTGTATTASAPYAVGSTLLSTGLEPWRQRRACFCRGCAEMPSSISSTSCGWGDTENSASWMSCEEYVEARRTITSSPSSHHSTFDPGTNPSFCLMCAGTETCPCDVILDSIRAIGEFG